MNELLLATSNEGKIQELRDLLAPIDCIAQTTLGITDAEETGLSFVENALLKARHASHHAKKPALADDSGLVIPALNGEPGIYSARYAATQDSKLGSIDLVLEKLKNVPDNERCAYFYCAIVLVRHEKDPTPIIATGLVHGVITHKPSGTQGFGYDPIFFIPQYKCTFAQLPATVKNTLSHRAQALKKFKTELAELDNR